MKKIPLTQGMYALVDDEDYEYLSQWKWYAYKNYNTYYARRSLHNPDKGIYMHRIILNARNSKCLIDHVNHNGLDNRRCNLRICNHAQNQFNQRLYVVPKSSQYKGVSWHKKARKWSANISINNKILYIGLYNEEKDAAIAYDIKAKELRGKYACTNF